MCNPILVGMAIGAASSAIQGGDFGDIVLGAALGAAGGAIGAGGITEGWAGFGGAAGAYGSIFSSTAGEFFATGVSTAFQYGSRAAFLGSMVTGTGMFAQPDYSQFGYGAQPYEPKGYSYQHATVTGSGGRQAAGVLAEEIKRTRTLRQRQQEETTAYNVAGELASTGLQIA